MQIDATHRPGQSFASIAGVQELNAFDTQQAQHKPRDAHIRLDAGQSFQPFVWCPCAKATAHRPVTTLVMT